MLNLTESVTTVLSWQNYAATRWCAKIFIIRWLYISSIISRRQKKKKYAGYICLFSWFELRRRKGNLENRRLLSLLPASMIANAMPMTRFQFKFSIDLRIEPDFRESSHTIRFDDSRLRRRFHMTMLPSIFQLRPPIYQFGIRREFWRPLRSNRVMPQRTSSILSLHL